jgi:uncharacterized protein (TIGR02246 family)
MVEMKTFKLLLLILIATISNLSAQTNIDAVKGVINRLFDGMRNGDSAEVASLFTSDAIMQTIASKDGKTAVRQDKVSNFTSFVGKQAKGTADEQIEFETIKIDGELAFVWTPYKFIRNGQFSHRGVNAFCLLQQEGQWKIHYIIDTRRK